MKIQNNFCIIMHNLIVLLEKSEDIENTSLKAAMLYLNRFSIDEDAACEISGVYYLKNTPKKMMDYTKSLQTIKPSEYLANQYTYQNIYKAKREFNWLFFSRYTFLKYFSRIKRSS